LPIQQDTAVDNGTNGTKDKNGNAVGWLYKDKTGWVMKQLQPKSAGFPLLDVSTTATTQTYSNPSPYNVANGVGTVTDNDAPTSATPQAYGGAPGSTGIAVDNGRHYQLYLVWQYNNSGPDGKTIVYYPIAYTFWQAVFYATAGQPPAYADPPIKNIQIPIGVTSSGPNNYTASNQVPGQLVVSPQTISNGNLGWAPA
jgi:hypothetical protein